MRSATARGIPVELPLNDVDDVWESSRRLLGDFYARHHRYPRPDSTEPAERVLAAWVDAQLSSELDDRSESRGLLLDLTPGWRLTRLSLHGE